MYRIVTNKHYTDKVINCPLQKTNVKKASIFGNISITQFHFNFTFLCKFN